VNAINARDGGITPPARADSAHQTRLQGRRLWLARSAWMAGFVALAAMYALGILAVHDVLSTVCRAERCTLREHIRQGEAGPEAQGWAGPGIGFAEPLRPDQADGLQALGLTLEHYGWLGALQMGIPALVCLVIAAGLFWKKSHDRMVLFVSVMVMTFPLQDMPLSFVLASRQPAWEWVYAPASLTAVVRFLTFPLVFPTGGFVPRWTRWAVVYIVTGAVLAVASQNAMVGVPDARKLVGAWVATSFGIGVYAQLYRYFRVAGPGERQQLKWVIVGLAAFIGLTFTLQATLEALRASPAVRADPLLELALSALANTVVRAASLFIPISITVSVLRYRLWDIDLVFNRALVYGALTAIVVGLYVLVVGALGALFQGQGSPLLAVVATGLVALLFQPLRHRLQRGINRLMYGERDDPYTVVARLGERLGATLAPEVVLPAIVQTVKDALRLPYAAITLKQGGDFVVAAASGTPVDDPLRLALTYRGDTVGELILAPRAPGESFTPADRRLLDGLAHQAGVAVHAVRLTTDLQRARERLVTTREEERRRLRRDLHDGLGPQLASQTLTLDAIDRLLERDPAGARRLLADLKGQSETAVRDIRRLIYGLRPPALDDLGLVAALDQDAAQYRDAGLQIAVEVPAPLPALPAAVEAAAYRIAQEAVTNVVRHAGARHCQVRLTLEPGAPNSSLRLEVADDGRGLSAERRAGIGLQSMRERAEELGGRLTVERRPGSGTRVIATLPLIEEDVEEGA
jgi:signal transduction histidine kinase